jgi:hypothetical protein
MEDEQILAYDFYLNELKKIVEHLKPLFGSSNKLYVKRIGQIHFLKSIVKNLIFLRANYNQSPFTAFVTLSRMIVDHYSAFFLIASFSNENEQKLRYYLIMIASLEGRIKTMSEFEKSLNNLPSEVIKGNQEAIKNDLIAVEIFSQRIIKENLNEIVDDKHIRKRNWKFPNLIPAENKNFYNWQELYNIAKIPSHFSKAIQQHFSEFTHGLGLTILYTDNKLDSKLSIIAILCLIQSLIGKVILDEYKTELKSLNLDEKFIYNCNYNWENWK